MTAPLFPLGVGLLPVDLEAGATVSMSWITDVMKSLSGKEQRVGNRSKPQLTFNFSVHVDDARGRALLSLLARYAHTAPTWRLALPWEGFTVKQSAPTTIECHSLTQCDWDVTGQPIAIRHPNGTFAETIIASAAGAVLTVDNNVTAAAVPGALVMPVMPVVLEPETQFSRYAVRAGRLSMVAHAVVNKLADGTMGSGAAVATYDSLDVWDWGVQVDGTVAQPIFAGGSILNAGLVLGAMAAFTRPDWKRDLKIESNARAHYQYLKKFLDTVHGSRRTFLAPTGRPDLVPVGDASSGTLTVQSPPTTNAPDYINDWYPSLAHRRLRIVKTDGTSAYRKVNSTADNGGTQDLVLDTALAGGIAQVEFLETCRLEAKPVKVAWGARGFESTLTAVVVQR